MSDTTVFVDDAVQGHLPMVCVRTGAPADGLHRVIQRIGGLSGWAFLLVFLGPVGWLVLVALAVAFRGRDLDVRLPYSHGAIEQERREFRAAIVAFAVTALAGIGAVALASNRFGSLRFLLPVLVVAVMAGVVAAFVLAARYVGRRPAVRLDASNRWVTLRGVDPAFAAAVRDQQVARRLASN